MTCKIVFFEMLSNVFEFARLLGFFSFPLTLFLLFFSLRLSHPPGKEEVRLQQPDFQIRRISAPGPGLFSGCLQVSALSSHMFKEFNGIIETRVKKQTH